MSALTPTTYPKRYTITLTAYQKLCLVEDALERIRDRSAWSRAAFARDMFGEWVDAGSAKAVRWCAIGSCERSYQVLGYGMLNETRPESFFELFNPVLSAGSDIMSVNDSPLHNAHDCVISVFEKLIEVLRTQVVSEVTVLVQQEVGSTIGEPVSGELVCAR